MTSTTYLANLVREELAQAAYLEQEARRELRAERASRDTYAYYHNGQVEGVY